MNHLGQQRRFGMQEGYSTFYGLIVCLVFSLPILPARHESFSATCHTNELCFPS